MGAPRGNQVALGRQPERMSMEMVTGHAGTRGSQGHARTRFVHKKEVNRAEGELFAGSSSEGSGRASPDDQHEVTESRYFLASETKEHQRT